jgi:hypothetical protein
VECKVGLAAVLARGAIIGAGVMQGIGAGEKIARIAGEPKREFKEFHRHMQLLAFLLFGAEFSNHRDAMRAPIDETNYISRVCFWVARSRPNAFEAPFPRSFGA